MLFGAVYLATFFLPFNNNFTPYRNSEVFDKNIPYSLTVFANFDGIHYIQIAQRGYQLLEQPFFPLYPIFIRLTALIFHLPFIISAQVVSCLSFLLALLVMGKLLTIDRKKHLWTIMLAAIFLFPTSFFYTASYNDALFLLFSCLTIYCARKKIWFWSGILAALATLTRLNGLALVFLIIFEYVFAEEKDGLAGFKVGNLRERLRKSFSVSEIIRSKIYMAFLPVIAFFSYLVYVQKTFKDWRLVFSTMKIWGQEKITLPLQVFWRYIKIIFLHPTFQLNYWVAVLELAVVLFYIFLIIYSFKKIRLSYWVFIVVSLLIPSFTGTFQGMPRYGLHLYPLFLAWALFLSGTGRILRVIYLLISLLLLFFCLTLFTRGYFVA